MAKSGDYVYWTCSIIVYVIGIIFAIIWCLREWTKRKQIRIIKFSQHDEASSSLEKSTESSITTTTTTTTTTNMSMKQLNKQTLDTKHYIEVQFHYLSLIVYFLSIMHLFFGLGKHFTLFCMFINQIIITTITFLKISITLFQLERYETCFGRTRTLTNKIIFNTFKLIMALYGLYTAIGVWYIVKPSVWEGVYCIWDFSNNIMGFFTAGGLIVFDWCVLLLFSTKIITLARTMSKMNHNNETQLRTNKLYGILQRLLILSFTMECTYMIVIFTRIIANVWFSDGFGNFAGIISVIATVFDTCTNIKFLSLMLQHNTKLRMYIHCGTEHC